VLTDRGTEFCGNPEHHEYELYLAIEDIDHTRTKARSRRPTEFASAFIRPCSMNSIASPSASGSTRRSNSLQGDLDAWMTEYNQARSHQGRWCFGKSPMQTFLDTLPIAKEKSIRAA
jgi:hypothetical protein